MKKEKIKIKNAESSLVGFNVTYKTVVAIVMNAFGLCALNRDFVAKTDGALIRCGQYLIAIKKADSARKIRSFFQSKSKMCYCLFHSTAQDSD